MSYATYIEDRYTGFFGDRSRNDPANLNEFSIFIKRLADDGGTPKYARPCAKGR
tara:strand:- start:349 stop:510 length:162 start_codon:yes stop_codon:yes gene_type:complete